jgi:hypothetical protein
MTSTQKLTKSQMAAKRRFELIIANAAVADEVYDALPQSFSGRVISTDIARFLDVSYRTVPAGKLRDIIPSWEGAWRYAQERLEREITNRGHRRTLRFMAGGWASGKTFALEDAERTDLAWDGTLGDPEWAESRVVHALEFGWRVQIAYVQRPIELALWGALDRAWEEGRVVPLLELPGVHARVQRSMLRLHKVFGSDPRVAFALIYNAGTRANPQKPRKLSISDIAPGGAIHYTDADVKGFQQAAREVWRSAQQSGHYPAEILSAAGAGMGTEAGE